MAKTIFDKDNSNLTTNRETSDTVTRTKDPNEVYQLVNSSDADVDFVLQGTRDEDDFSEAADLQTTTVTSANADVDFITLNADAWEKLRVEVTPGTDPTSGSVQVYRMAEIS